MNPIKTIQNIFCTIMTVLFLYWFGISAFKLGFYAKETPIVNSFVEFLLGKNKSLESKSDSSTRKTIQDLFFKFSPEK